MLFTQFLSDKLKRLNILVDDHLLIHFELSLAVIGVLFSALCFFKIPLLLTGLTYLLYLSWFWCLITVFIILFNIKSNKPTNPYITGSIVTPPHFVGRRVELMRLRDAWEKNESLAFVGNRRIGKSSLLKTWQAELESKAAVVKYVSGQDGINNLAKFIKVVCGEENKKNNKADKAANALQAWAKQHILNTKHAPTILLDEAENLIKTFPAQFWIRMRACCQAHQLLFVFSSYQDLNEIYKQSHDGDSPFNNVVINLSLGLLEQDAAQQLINLGKFSKQQQQLMHDWAGNHAFFLQIIGEELYIAKQTQQASQQAQDQANKRAEPHLQHFWKHSQASEQHVLKQLAQGLPTKGLESLRLNGLLTADNQLFAKVWRQWLQKK